MDEHYMSFRERVYRIVAGIPAGRVMSYSGVAGSAGNPGAARAVGTLMARNPRPGTGLGKVPCHRVVKADGSLGGFSGRNGSEGKRTMLEEEGVRFSCSTIKRECFLSMNEILLWNQTGKEKRRQVVPYIRPTG